jgi:hypothetical protein
VLGSAALMAPQRWRLALLVLATVLHAPCAGQNVTGAAQEAPFPSPPPGFAVAAGQPGCDACEAERVAQGRAAALERWHDALQARSGTLLRRVLRPAAPRPAALTRAARAFAAGPSGTALGGGR